jgi:hypothetical protein
MMISVPAVAPVANVTAVPMPVETVAMGTVLPMETAAATRAPMGASSTTMGAVPRHRNGAVEGFNTMGPVGKMVCVFVFLLTVGAGGFFFFRMVVQNCGCPEDDGWGRRLQHGTHEDTCFCEGDVFSCKWQCGSTCYSGGEPSNCDGSFYGNTTSATSNPDQGGAGSVNCPGASSYCDCDEDCGSSSYCGCAEAQASGCCGR